MAKKLEMPARGVSDGPVSIRRISIGPVERVILEATQSGKEQAMELSEYNAWRMFGMLSLMLGIPLPAHVGKAIKLG